MTTQQLLVQIAVIAALHMCCNASVMRNKALINKMVSRFQKDSYASAENERTTEDKERWNQHNPERVIALMQNVLCRNFPTIPCKVIAQDDTLKKLIKKSIQQIKYTSLKHEEKTTASPGYLTLFPTMNEELTNYLQARSRNEFDKRSNEATYKKTKQKKGSVNFWSKDKYQKTGNKRTVYNGKKLRKFYPHKIKYKDKGMSRRRDYGDYTEEKLSMSVEVPDMTQSKHHQHLRYKMEPADPPVWRIDYMKHGEPSLKTQGFDDRLKGKIMKTGPNVIVDEGLEQVRKDVLHPDVYIKNNFVRQPSVNLNNSDNIE